MLHTFTRCLAGDFILEHFHLCSANNTCLILGDFIAPENSWAEMATVLSTNLSESRFQITVMKHALVEHVSKPTLFGPNRGFSLSDWVITHATEDILPLLAISNHAVLSFTFGASDLKDDQAEPRSNVWIAAKTDWSVDSDSQLFYDGFQTMAVNLVNLVSPSAACGPSNRLFRLVKLGLSASEDEHEKSGVIEGESIAPGTGIDLEVESESSTMAPEAALYETCYVTAHKAACRAASFNSTGQLVATGSHDSSIKILDVERMLAKSVSPTDHLGQETPQQQMETHPEVTCVDFHPDPTLQILVSGSKDYTIKLFDFSNPSVKKAQRNIPLQPVCDANRNVESSKTPYTINNRLITSV
ncbi:unnamed protein product [Schistosoma mattheei]|uniref:Cleavage stimulation factor 50 kDa subunit n=1 Tax=Schistosoma mattheei TaxID=31246 RepID=A0A183PA66_9TREM|nr:unnamed protein product [Schistosoma mattheei]